uniref:Sir2-a zinc finger protein n=1 Tax=Phallusia mammillata TaxID=59560 RepID=A0A6F9DST6_9ASCI|nr:Sir2-a zinc finger protein [Phallusia mammillata]
MCIAQLGRRFLPFIVCKPPTSLLKVSKYFILVKTRQYVTPAYTSNKLFHHLLSVDKMGKSHKSKKILGEVTTKPKPPNHKTVTTEKSSSSNSKSLNSNHVKPQSQVKVASISDDKPPSKLKPITTKDEKQKLPSHKKRKGKKHSDAVAGISQSMSKLELSPNKIKQQRRLPGNIQKTRAYSSHSAGPSQSKSAQLNSLDEMVKYIESGRAKNIVVMCGAGISTASGIPDFRSPGTGLYDNLQKYRIPFPTAVFDLNYFHNNPRPFFELAKELYPSGKYRPNSAHYFVRALHEKGLLMRLYTQNIDGLERISGIPSSKLVEAHGTFATASCTKCGKKYDGEDIKAKIFNGKIPRCQLTPLCYGIIKPDIVFFGEDLPKRFYYYLRDFPVCDMLIVMGTSLEVEPFASLVDSTRYNIPRLLLNRDRVGPFERRSRGRPNDHALTGELTATIDRLVAKLGWKDFLHDLTVRNEKATAEGAMASDEGRTDSGVSSASSISSKDSDGSGGKISSLHPPADPDIKRYFRTIRSTPLPKPNSKIRECGSGEPSANSNPSNLSYYDFIRNNIKPHPTPLKPPNHTSNTPPRQVDSSKSLMTIYNVSKTTKPPAAPTIQYAQTVVGTKSDERKRYPLSRKLSTISMPNLERQSSETDSSQSESDDSDTSSDT